MFPTEVKRRVNPMDATTRGAALEWGHTGDSSRKRFLGPLKIGPFLLGGIEPIYELPLIDVNRQGVYLTFPEGAALAENQIFRIVRPLRRREDPVFASGHPRRVVAKVKIVRVIEKSRVLVRVLKGSIIKGTGAEKIEGGSPR
jgi:hypothetical protein